MSKDRGDYIWSPAPGSRLIEAVAWPKASTPLRFYPFKASFTKSQQIGLAREQFSAVWLSVDLTPKITIGRRRFHLLFKPIVSSPMLLMAGATTLFVIGLLICT